MVNTTNTTYDFLSESVVEGGMLNEQGVMNVALSFFDLNRDLTDDSAEKEVILFKQILPLAEVFCASMSDWSFLTESIEYEDEDVDNDEPVLYDDYEEAKGKWKGETYTGDDDETYVHVYTMYKNFRYAYILPSDFLKMRYVDGDPRRGFAVKGNTLYCNELGCTVEYISTNLRNLPLDFGYLIAYKTAVELAQHLDPEGTAMQRASAMFQQTFSVLKQRDDMNFRFQQPAQNHHIDIDSTFWGYKR